MNQTQQGGSDRQTGAVATGAPLLVFKKLDKRFGATHALKAVDLVFEAGEIHAIVGENGAGKSTLIKLLTGVHVRTSGEIYWEGQPVALATPHEAIDHGINAVHQEVVLCPHLSVAANLFLGDEKVRLGLLKHREMAREAGAGGGCEGFSPAFQAPCRLIAPWRAACVCKPRPNRRTG